MTINDRILATLLAGTLLASGPIAAETAPPSVDERLAWLRENALALRSIDPDDEDFSDLAPLVERIGAARVVQLGEATHGDGSTFLAKARLIRFLHQVMGFDGLAWEAGFFDCRDVDAALRSDEPIPVAAARGLYRIWWKSAEVQHVLAYVRATQSTPRPITTVGFDSRVSTADGRAERFPRFVFDFFDRLDPRLISTAERADLTAMSVGLVPQDYYDHPGPRSYNRDLVRRLVTTIDERRAELKRHYGRHEIDYARQTLVSLMNMDRALEEGQARGVAADGFSRDAAMGLNLVWWLEGPLAGRKVVVWAHNYHVQEALAVPWTAPAPPFSGSAGRFLVDALGDEVYTVAVLSYEGAFALAGEPPEPLPRPAPDALEALLHAAGHPYLWVDLDTLPDGHWLRARWTAGFNLYMALEATDWSRVYDAILFIDVQHPVTVIPGG